MKRTKKWKTNKYFSFTILKFIEGLLKMAEIVKRFVQPDEIRLQSFKLAKEIYSYLKNNNLEKKKVFLVGFWRGGSFIDICVDEYLLRKGIQTDCVPIRTSRYTGVGKASEGVNIHSTGHLRSSVTKDDIVVLVDDVWDSGTSIMEVKKLMTTLTENILVGVVFFKPTKNKFPEERPNFFVESSNEWLNFPHELEGLSEKEIFDNFGEDVHKVVCE